MIWYRLRHPLLLTRQIVTTGGYGGINSEGREPGASGSLFLSLTEHP
jgi:hypothetical protein